jgi:hypothetical protein
MKDVMKELDPFEGDQDENIDSRDIFELHSYDIGTIKNILNNMTNPSDRTEYISNLWRNFFFQKKWKKEREYTDYEFKKLIPFFKTEFDRLENEKKVRNKNKPVNKIKLNWEKRVDFIRMISEMVDNEIFEPVNSNVFLTKEYVLEAFGTWLDEDLHEVVEIKKTLIQTETEKTSEKSNEEGKAFPDYLLYEDKIKLAEAIKNEFKTEKGKAIRILLEAMKIYQPHLISIGIRQRTELHGSIKLYFNRNIGSIQSVFDYPFDEETDQADIESVTIRLKHLLNMIEKDKTA